MDNELESIAKDLLCASIIIFIYLAIKIAIKAISASIRNIKKHTHTLTVQATCVEIEESSDSDSTTFRPIFEYQMNGQTRKVKNSVYSNPMYVQVGDQFELLVDPNNPEKSYAYSDIGIEQYRQIVKTRGKTRRVVLIIILTLFWIAFAARPLIELYQYLTR